MNKIGLSLLAVWFFTGTGAHGASISSDSYSLNFEFNRHSKINEFTLALEGSCAKKDILKMYNRCPVEISKSKNERVIRANRFSQFDIPAVKVSGKGGLKTPRLTYELILFNKTVDQDNLLGIFNFNQEKRSNTDISKITQEFASRNTIYVTTIPEFSIESNIHLNIDSLRTKLKNCWLTKNDSTPCFDYTMEAQMVDRKLKKILYPKSLTEYRTIYNTPRLMNEYTWRVNGKNKTLKNGNSLTTHEKNAFVTYQKPHAFMLELTYSIQYLGKYKKVKLKPIYVDDLDNINLTEAIGVVELEINDSLGE